VLHAPADLDVVSFFVISRLADRSDGPAFTRQVSEHLAALLEEPPPPSGPVADEEGERLLEAAAERAQPRDRRLLLVVDGLDEDQGARPGSGRPSIASLLPSRPHPALRMLVMSRLHPDLPRDVPHDHPLRRAVPRILEPYAGAQDLAQLATQEVLDAINGDRLDADVLVFLTASSDGLSVDELAELTGQLGSQIESRVESAFGRSLAVAPPWGLLSRDVVYFFAHD
jgi:hypothetical protein